MASGLSGHEVTRIHDFDFPQTRFPHEIFKETSLQPLQGLAAIVFIEMVHVHHRTLSALHLLCQANPTDERVGCDIDRVTILASVESWLKWRVAPSY